MSGFRRARRNVSRQRLIDEALKLMAAGNFRPTGLEITSRAGCHHGAINYHFGAVDLMMRVLAREHCEAVAALLPITFPDPKVAVWLVLVGRPRSL